MNRIPLVLLTLLAIAGCAGSPARIQMMDAEELKAVGVGPLCNAYAFSNQSDELIRSELQRRDRVLIDDPSYSPRKAFTEREWNAIQTREIFMGMSEAALICAWGTPSLYGDVNTSTGSWGTHRQWVYRPCDSCDAQYVYTENGLVTAWQD